MGTHEDRREFLKTAVAAGAAFGFPAIVPASALGRDGTVAPSQRVNVGVISCASRSGVVGAYKKYEKSQIVVVCDPIEQRRLQRKQQIGDCDACSDFREVLARDDVDAVHISTGDHWHVPISLAAARAGKDMYTEKPLGVSAEQALAARQITRKYDRIFQYGTQNRSGAQVRMGTELVLNGHIGDVKELYVWCPPGQSGGSPTPVLPVPEGFDYDMWQGPAAERPFCKDRCLVQGPLNGVYNIFDYAIEFIVGWGAHPMDQLQWWSDQSGMGVPVKYEGGGTVPADGLFNTITHWGVSCTYANGQKMRFMDNETARTKAKIPQILKTRFSHGTLYVGTKGWVIVSRGSWKVFPETLYQKARNPEAIRLPESNQHQKNFIDAVLSRKQPISNLESAVQSDLICHFSDISVRTGRAIRWDPAQQTIVGDAEATKMMKRPMREPWTL